MSLHLFAQGILPFIHVFEPGDEIAVIKAVLKELGHLRSDELSLPLLRCSKQRLKEVMIAYEMAPAQLLV